MLGPDLPSLQDLLQVDSLDDFMSTSDEVQEAVQGMDGARECRRGALQCGCGRIRGLMHDPCFASCFGKGMMRVVQPQPVVLPAQGMGNGRSAPV